MSKSYSHCVIIPLLNLITTGTIYIQKRQNVKRHRTFISAHFDRHTFGNYSVKSTSAIGERTFF